MGNLIDLEEFKVEDVIEKLKEKRPLFHYETDFQFALAWKIKENYNNVEVRLEYFFGEDEEGHRQYIDILVMNKEKNECIPIELKYKTRQENDEGIYVKKEKFNLKDQYADNDARFYLYEDIERIQNLVIVDKNKKEKYNTFNNMKIVKGYVIFLTNDAIYGYIYNEKFNTGIRNLRDIKQELYFKKDKFKEFNKYLNENNKNDRKVEIPRKKMLEYSKGTINEIKHCEGYWSIYSDYDEEHKKEEEKDPMKYVYQLVFEIKNKE